MLLPFRVVCAVALAATLPALAAPAHTARQSRYTVTTTDDIVQMKDSAAGITVSLVAGLSNAYEMVVKGQQVIRKPFADLAEFRARPGLSGIPLLAPYANRLDEQAFYANGRKYSFDMGLGNVRGEIPIHGFLTGVKDWRQ